MSTCSTIVFVSSGATNLTEMTSHKEAGGAIKEHERMQGLL